MSKRYLWVVEMLINGKWESTVGAGCTRADARREKAGYWEYNNPADKFRVVKYTPAE